jgi:ectoine hydroxylase
VQRERDPVMERLGDFAGRWSMICCYNAARNNPYKEPHHPRYTPLHKVPDSAILEAGLKRFADSTEDVAWLEDKHS